MTIFTRLRYLFTASEELDSLIIDRRRKLLQEKYERNKHRLSLCLKHQQEQTHSIYSEDSCDYCKLQRKLERCQRQ